MNYRIKWDIEECYCGCSDTFQDICWKSHRTDNVILAKQQSRVSDIYHYYDSFASPMINFVVGYELARRGEQSMRPTNKIRYMAQTPGFNSGRIADIVRRQICRPTNRPTVQWFCGFILAYDEGRPDSNCDDRHCVLGAVNYTQFDASFACRRE